MSVGENSLIADQTIRTVQPNLLGNSVQRVLRNKKNSCKLPFMRNSYWIEMICLKAKYFFFLKVKRKPTGNSGQHTAYIWYIQRKNLSRL